jgi:hypothetical protein
VSPLYGLYAQTIKRIRKWQEKQAAPSPQGAETPVMMNYPYFSYNSRDKGHLLLSCFAEIVAHAPLLIFSRNSLKNSSKMETVPFLRL